MNKISLLMQGDALLWKSVKYIGRAGKKGSALKDLRKAVTYLNRRIERLAEESAKR